ncbi:MAG TPA: dTDP-4-dehydrorhamnose 3,5-epimerase family protein [Actinomycetota bacterium]|nr:dTDP-4-dehydrorhamnose 3,5-epimerase family protein [Actinomycetota bacterium]
MNAEPVEGIPGAILFTPQVHADGRGSFMEIFRQDALGVDFVQANHSHSAEGVLRGLHYHRRQSDAWYVINGEAQAMLADIRTPSDSPAVASVTLSAEHPQVLYIPPGVAHGFLAVTTVDLIYWVTTYYDASDEFGVAWDDPTLGAPWKLADPVLSNRDRTNPRLEWSAIPAWS